jgi:hypothetical protein
VIPSSDQSFDGGGRFDDGAAQAGSGEAFLRVPPRRSHPSYGLNYLIDIENAVIVDVEATPARTYDEVAAHGQIRRCQLGVKISSNCRGRCIN